MSARCLVAPLAVVLPGLVACGAGERPEPELEGTDTQAVATARASSAVERCEPGSYRVCQLRYVDDQGRVQCPADLEFCREDGLGYHACGAYVMSTNGPVPRERPAQKN